MLNAKVPAPLYLFTQNGRATRQRQQHANLDGVLCNGCVTKRQHADKSRRSDRFAEHFSLHAQIGLMQASPKQILLCRHWSDAPDAATPAWIA